MTLLHEDKPPFERYERLVLEAWTRGGLLLVASSFVVVCELRGRLFYECFTYSLESQLH